MEDGTTTIRKEHKTMNNNELKRNILKDLTSIQSKILNIELQALKSNNQDIIDMLYNLFDYIATLFQDYIKGE